MANCPSSGCSATRFKIENVGGKNMLLCESGHVISRDYSQELNAWSDSMHKYVLDVLTALRKENAEFKNKIEKHFEELKEHLAEPGK